MSRLDFKYLYYITSATRRFLIRKIDCITKTKIRQQQKIDVKMTYNQPLPQDFFVQTLKIGTRHSDLCEGVVVGGQDALPLTCFIWVLKWDNFIRISRK